MFLSAITTVSGLVAGLSSTLVSSIPVVGKAVASVSGAIGSAVSGVATNAGFSSTVGTIVGNTTRTAINSTVYNSYSNRND